MTRRRWIADEVEGDRAALTGDHAAHLSRVLRAHPGQQFEIAVHGRVRVGTVLQVNDYRVEFELGEDINVAAIIPVTVLLSVFKFDRMEWAIEKLTELGVEEIVPVIARRTEKFLASAAQSRCERWQRLALQASEQARRASPPDVASPAKVKEVVALKTDTRILLAESERGTTFRQALLDASSANSLALAVGPEGGWTDEEFQLFTAHGWTSASLGSTILRAETAAISAAAIAIHQLSNGTIPARGNCV